MSGLSVSRSDDLGRQKAFPRDPTHQFHELQCTVQLSAMLAVYQTRVLSTINTSVFKLGSTLAKDCGIRSKADAVAIRALHGGPRIRNCHQKTPTPAMTQMLASAAIEGQIARLRNVSIRRRAQMKTKNKLMIRKLCSESAETAAVREGEEEKSDERTGGCLGRL